MRSSYPPCKKSVVGLIFVRVVPLTTLDFAMGLNLFDDVNSNGLVINQGALCLLWGRRGLIFRRQTIAIHRLPIILRNKDNQAMKCLRVVSPPHFVYDFSRKLCILVTDQFSLPDCLYFMRYWAIYVLQLFVSQVVTS